MVDEPILTALEFSAGETDHRGQFDQVGAQFSLESAVRHAVDDLLSFKPVALEMGGHLLDECHSTSYKDFPVFSRRPSTGAGDFALLNRLASPKPAQTDGIRRSSASQRTCHHGEETSCHVRLPTD